MIQIFAQKSRWDRLLHSCLGLMVVIAQMYAAGGCCPAGRCVEPPPPSQSCAGQCGGKAPSGCGCDAECTARGDCCQDYAATCVNPPPLPPLPLPPLPPPVEAIGCTGHCGVMSPGMCFCDDGCPERGDCCADYQQVCAGSADAGEPPDGWWLVEFEEGGTVQYGVAYSRSVGSLVGGNPKDQNKRMFLVGTEEFDAFFIVDPAATSDQQGVWHVVQGQSKRTKNHMINFYACNVLEVCTPSMQETYYATESIPFGFALVDGASQIIGSLGATNIQVRMRPAITPTPPEDYWARFIDGGDGFRGFLLHRPHYVHFQPLDENGDFLMADDKGRATDSFEGGVEENSLRTVNWSTGEEAVARFFIPPGDGGNVLRLLESGGGESFSRRIDTGTPVVPGPLTGLWAKSWKYTKFPEYSWMEPIVEHPSLPRAYMLRSAPLQREGNRLIMKVNGQVEWDGVINDTMTRIAGNDYLFGLPDVQSFTSYDRTVKPPLNAFEGEWSAFYTEVDVTPKGLKYEPSYGLPEKIIWDGQTLSVVSTDSKGSTYRVEAQWTGDRLKGEWWIDGYEESAGWVEFVYFQPGWTLMGLWGYWRHLLTIDGEWSYRRGELLVDEATIVPDKVYYDPNPYSDIAVYHLDSATGVVAQILSPNGQPSTAVFTTQQGEIRVTADERGRPTSITDGNVIIRCVWSDDSDSVDVYIEENGFEEFVQTISVDWSDEAVLSAFESSAATSGIDVSSLHAWIANNPGRIAKFVQGEAGTFSPSPFSAKVGIRFSQSEGDSLGNVFSWLAVMATGIQTIALGAQIGLKPAAAALALNAGVFITMLGTVVLVGGLAVLIVNLLNSIWKLFCCYPVSLACFTNVCQCELESWKNHPKCNP